VRCFHRQYRKHLHLCNRSLRRNNQLSKISSLSRKLNSLRLMVMHQHQIKQHRINSPQQISRHLKMVPQLMRLMVMQAHHLNKQQMILLLHQHLLQVQHHVRQQAMRQHLLQHLHHNLHLRIMRHPHQWHLQHQRKWR
jgi:hypothetical protein